MEVSHPGYVDREELMRGSERGREWYEQSIRYTARLIIESAQEHPEVRETLMNNKREVFSAIQTYDPEVYADISELGLGSYQKLSAEKAARRYAEE